MNQPENTKEQIKTASNAALASLLNMTLLPVISFIYLILVYKKTQADQIDQIDHYHAMLGIKLNLIAAAALFLVSVLMILLGGFDSPWTWVYVISYFTIVHTAFIIVAVWALVRSWSGDKLRATS